MRDCLAIVTVVGFLLSVCAVVFGWRDARTSLRKAPVDYEKGKTAYDDYKRRHPHDNAGAKAAFEKASETPMTTYDDMPRLRPLIAELISQGADEQFKRYAWMLLGGVVLQTTASVCSLYV